MGPLRAALAALAASAILAPAALAAPPGYVRIESGDIAAPPTTFDFGGRADCPPGTVVWSGGVGGTSDFGQDINSSNPTGSGWEGRYNNRSTRNGAFEVEAICAAQPKHYTQTFALAANPAGTQVSSHRHLSGEDRDPRRRRPVVVGRREGVPAQRLSGHHEDVHGGHLERHRRNEQLAVYAICGKKPKGYELNAATGSGTGPAEFSGGGQCKRFGKVVIGGGVQVADPQPSISLGTSFADQDTQWLTNVDVQTGGLQTTTIYSICAA